MQTLELKTVEEFELLRDILGAALDGQKEALDMYEDVQGELQNELEVIEVLLERLGAE